MIRSSLILSTAIFSSCTVTVPHIAKLTVPPLSGIVVDSRTKLPIEGATLRFHGLSKSETRSDSKGQFKTKETENRQFTMLTHLYVTQDLQLEAKANGYENQTIPIYQKSAFEGRVYEKQFLRIPLIKKRNQ